MKFSNFANISYSNYLPCCQDNVKCIQINPILYFIPLGLKIKSFILGQPIILSTLLHISCSLFKSNDILLNIFEIYFFILEGHYHRNLSDTRIREYSYEPNQNLCKISLFHILLYLYLSFDLLPSYASLKRYTVKIKN